jgi:hypothetical protein
MVTLKGYVYVCSGKSLFDVGQKAINFFNTGFWKGPKPRPNDSLKISLIGEKRSWRVRVERVLRENLKHPH